MQDNKEVIQQSLATYFRQINDLSLVIHLADQCVRSICSKELTLQRCLNTFVSKPLFNSFPELSAIENELNCLVDSKYFQKKIALDNCNLNVCASLLPQKNEINSTSQSSEQAPAEHCALVQISVAEPATDSTFMYLLSRALEAAQHGITIADARLPNQPIIYCNQAFSELTGYNIGEILGRNCRFLQNSDNDQRGIPIIHQAIEKGTECKTVLRNYKKSGEMFWNELTISPVFNGSGEVTHFVGIQYDITDQMVVEGALKESERRYRTLFETNSDGIAYYDLDGSCLDANDTYCHMLGMKWEKVIESNSEHVTPKNWHRIDAKIRNNQIKQCQHCQEYEKELIRSNGEVFPVNVRQCLHINELGHPVAFWLLVRDISRQKETMEKLRHSKQLLTETGKLAKVGGWELFSDNTVFFTQETTSILKLTNNQSDLDTFSSMFHDEHSHLFSKSVEITLDTGEPLDLNLRTETENNTQWLRLQGNRKVNDEGRTVIVGAIQDITETKVAQDKLLEHESHLQHLAHHDTLTGLPNRLLYNDRLHHAITRASRENYKLAVLLLDLDRFKNINDSLGHEIGDQFLKCIANRANECIRQSDTFARLGGDEFVVLLEDTPDIHDVVLVAKKLLKAISKPVQVENHNLHSTASIGISLFPDNGTHGDELLRCADSAMYQVKEKGKNNYQFYTEEINHRAVELLILENDMHKALEDQNFTLHYQPQLSLSDLSIIGLESLVRWEHTGRGMISPGDFIPLAEESGLILKLGEWVLMESCRQAKEWLDMGYQFGRVAVNLSAKQFHRSDIVGQVKQALATFELPADNLELEITEGIAIENIEVTIETLKELKSLGIHLAIDDFGTGYSSLSYLKRFSIDKLKIDKSFVDDILTDEGGAAIATSTIALAHQMGLKVIAEGVETQQQSDFLKEYYCDEAQGYLYSRPLTKEQAEAFFQSHKTLKNL
ncbi:sensor domain-containing protein [Litoribacillus peritrichatus]|uniref:EAL domain-containing protein n=1 Tax=Litoribacillus peritrichatus TaxID=718191 RepID=A0ABP7M5T0_9GAMM